jgi:hypothetical protein
MGCAFDGMRWLRAAFCFLSALASAISTIVPPFWLLGGRIEVDLAYLYLPI